jgi:hypothetical protein
MNQLCNHRLRQPLTRRQMLASCGMGFGALALRGILNAGTAPVSPLAAKPPHLPARAKRVIFLFMHGGPSSIDTFDYKPRLQSDTGKPLPFAKPRVQFAQTGNLLGSPWEFQQHGESGLWVSSLFPEVARCVDDLCVIKSIHGSNEAHGGALLKIHTGSDTFVRPSMGAWISYGLGTENEGLPGFITMNPTMGHGGVQNFGAAFLPAIHQATRIGQRGSKVKEAEIANLHNEHLPLEQQRRELDLLQRINRMQLEQTGADAELEARIESFELAFRMQMERPTSWTSAARARPPAIFTAWTRIPPTTMPGNACWRGASPKQACGSSSARMATGIHTATWRKNTPSSPPKWTSRSPAC